MGNATSHPTSKGKQPFKGGHDAAVKGGRPRADDSGRVSPKNRTDEDVSVHVGHIPTRSILLTLKPNDPLDNPFLKSRMALTGDTDRLLIVMVGLPARGKSLISNKLKDFLVWRGISARLFSVGETRRNGTFARPGNTPASFFNNDMAIAASVREAVAMDTLKHALDWLDEGHPRQDPDQRVRVAIFDATNSTPKRRGAISTSAAARGASVVFLESVCKDVHVIKSNMLVKVHNSADFAGMDEAEAIADLTQRIDLYEEKYETLQDVEGAFIRLYDLNSKVQTHNIYGRMSKRVLPFLLAMHSWPRPVTLLATPPDDHDDFAGFVTDVLRTMGSPSFRKANRLCRSTAKLRLFASTHAAATTLAAAIAAEGHWPLEVSHTAGLNAAAVHEAAVGFTERVGGADSYADQVGRLESVLLDIEASMQPVLVLAPPTPLRLLRAYLLGLDVGSNMHSASAAGAAALDGTAKAMLEFDISVTGQATERVTPLTTTTLKVDLAGDA